MASNIFIKTQSRFKGGKRAQRRPGSEESGEATNRIMLHGMWNRLHRINLKDERQSNEIFKMSPYLKNIDFHNLMY